MKSHFMPLSSLKMCYKYRFVEIAGYAIFAFFIDFIREIIKDMKITEGDLAQAVKPCLS